MSTGRDSGMHHRCLVAAALGLSLIALGLLVVCTPLTSAQAKLVVKIGTGARADAPLGALMESVAQEIEARGGGRLLAKRFADGALGATRPALERVEAGEVQAYVATFAELTQFAPALAALSAPLLFAGADDLHKRRGHVVGKTVANVLAGRGLALAALGPCETRVLASKAPLSSESLARLRVREPRTTATRALYAALGAPLLPATDSSDPDLADLPLESLVAMRETRWARHVTFLGHAVECRAVVYSQRWLDGLPQALQKELRAPLDAAMARAIEDHAALRTALLATLERMGVSLELRAPKLRRALSESARVATQEIVRDLGADAARIVAAARR